MLRQALPEPKRAIKDALRFRKAASESGYSKRSNCTRHMAKALIPEAEEAIPEL